jgi:hypothetical protein
MATTTSSQGDDERYLYGRLGDKRFQELCNALLVNEFAGGQVQCFPVGQSDGGRDAVRRHNGRTVIYQAKWTKKPIKNPVGWLEGAIKGESAKITQLVVDGADEYILLTSLAGTSVPGRGTMDQLDAILAQHSTNFGIPMKCWWRADVDARVDNASRELKWAYSEMLAGNDLIRYLMEADRTETHMGKLRDLVLKVVAAQEKEDARVKFKRVELDVYNLADLFVDVEAQRSRPARGGNSWVQGPTPPAQLGGAARYLLNAEQPWTLVTGEPGQGKSTLGQYVCQVHRHALLGTNDPKLQPATPANIRVPLRIDLRDYASWLAGVDPFGATSTGKPKTRLRTQGAIEQFLVPFIEARSGGLPCDITVVHEIMQRFPTLVVLDGLDEVAQVGVRQRVVQEIDAFAGRLRVSGIAPQLVVTTRPNSSDLPEPSNDTFESIVLSRLSDALRTSYLRKWADANNVRGPARRSLQRTFRERSAEPHIALLADNPMQLTILLYLIHKRGDSVPTGRTALYSSYMETLLDREGEKTRAIVDHRPELEEVTSYLGWHLQSLAEAQGGTGRLPIKALKKAILDYLYDVDKETGLVDDLFTTVTDRVWALTSKLQGTFEFDVQPLREYFAAKFLHDFAGADAVNFDSSDVLRELVRRAYWLNTTRFYVGFATPNELAGFVSGLAEEFARSDRARQVRTATWSLLADGVFAGRTRAQRGAVKLLTDDLSLILLRSHTTESDFAMPTPAHGGDHLVEALQAAIEADPNHSLTPSRLQLLATLRPDSSGYTTWWRDRMVAAIGTKAELAWLRCGAVGAAGSHLSAVELDRISPTPTSIRAILDSGAVPAPGSSLEQTLIRAVLNGQSSDCDPDTAGGYPGDILRLVAPTVLLSKANEGLPYRVRTSHREHISTDSRRTSAIARLKKRDPRFAKIQAALRFNRGEKGSTFPWANTAHELATIVGPCWLAAEIAIIGAAADPAELRTAGSSQATGAQPLGPTAHYGLLLQELRAHSTNADWWTQSFQRYADPLSRGTWALALLCVADESIIRALAPSVEQLLTDMSDEASYALLASSSRIGASGLARRISSTPPTEHESLTLTTLYSHHSVRLDQDDDLPDLSVATLAAMSDFGTAGWPAARALSARAASTADPAAIAGLRAFGHATQVAVPTVAAYPDSLVDAVFQEPSAYPADWVLAIENTATRNADETPLAAIAEVQHWFNASTP